jgi:hypothetical protein
MGRNMKTVAYAVAAAVLLYGCTRHERNDLDQPANQAEITDSQPSSLKLPDDGQPVLALWDGGNVFVQPKKTLIFAMWSTGKVVSRLRDDGKCALSLGILAVPKTKLMLGQMDSLRAKAIMQQLASAGFFGIDKYEGLVRPDGPNVILWARDSSRTNEIRHEAVEDLNLHAKLTSPAQRVFMRMWDNTMDTLRSIVVHNWRPVCADDNVIAEVPWVKTQQQDHSNKALQRTGK